MADTLAPYACDKCRSRKTSCCRTRAGCQRCKTDGDACIYSRSGVIRRKRKSKHEAPPINHIARPTNSHRRLSLSESRSGDNSLQSQVAIEIEVTRERLRGLSNPHHSSLGALSSLSDAYAEIWHDTSKFSMTGKSFFLFEDRDPYWTDVFVAALDKGRPMMNPAPPEVLEHLRASRPRDIHERAWLVMYYSIILSMITSTDPEDESTKTKLRCNLWLALNDVRLLLEPSEANIQALVLLACHVEEFTTPLLCWMLVGNACRMLQALGISHRSFDVATRERRRMIFWQLNVLDKGLAVAFGKPPNFHRAIAREVALPSLDQLLPFQPHRSSPNTPGLYGAHFMYQLFLKSRIMADVWECLHNDTAPDSHAIDLVIADLESWYGPARKLLEAAALVERPLLDPSGVASVDIGLHSISFSYEYLLILLTRSSSQRREQCMEASKRMLRLLEHMVSDSEEVFNGIVWQLICCPFAPFLVLFREIISNGKASSGKNRDNLAAIEQLPVFLKKMGLRSSLARRLERIALVFVQHAKSIVYPQDPLAIEAAPASSGPVVPLTDVWNSDKDTLNWDALLNQVSMAHVPGEPQMDNQDLLSSDAAAWSNDFFGEGIFDWILYDNQI